MYSLPSPHIPKVSLTGAGRIRQLCWLPTITDCYFLRYIVTLLLSLHCCLNTRSRAKPSISPPPPDCSTNHWRDENQSCG